MAGAVLYGIIHDQFTARICVEYFSVFHPPVFSTQSPTLLALGWGVTATWWVGTFLGVTLACAARLGSRRKMEAAELKLPLAKVLLGMGAMAIACGTAGYVLTIHNVISPPAWVSSILPAEKHAAFMTDWWAHNASYLSGFVGGLSLCVVTFRKRRSAEGLSG